MKKINNKTLLIIFGILVLLAVIVIIYDRHKGERSFRSELFSIDSAKVTAVTVFPKGKTDGALRLVKKGKGWEIECNKKTYPADTTVMERLLGTLLQARAERVAGTDRSSWKDLEITDSLSTRVIVEQDKETVADFRLGKISFTRENRPQGYGSNQNISLKTHIRLTGDDRVYVVDGFFPGMFSDQPSMYRNRTVCRFDKSLLTRLIFTYPGDSSFILTREGSRWLLNSRPTDSMKVESYLNNTGNLINSEFADENAIPITFPYSLKIEGNSMKPIEVAGAVEISSKQYFVKSDYNPAAVFGSANKGLFTKVFPGKSKFEVTKEKKTKK